MTEPTNSDRGLGPTGFSHFEAEPADPQRTEQMIELLDLQDADPGIQRLRDWALTAAAPAAGETAVDVGSGTGTVTQLLADRLGPGRAIGVEPNEEMRAEAIRRARAAGSVAEFVAGVADDLPFGDDSVNLIWCERVLQHLSDAPAAVREFARVLRPGGRLVVLDSDHASRVTADIDLAVEEKLNRTFLTFSPNPRAARYVPRQLRDAGLTMDTDIGSAALLLPPEELRKAQLLVMVAEAAVEQGVITQAEADAAVRSIRQAADEGVAFSAMSMFGFIGRKPGRST